MRVAVIDLGSNSFRLFVAEVGPTGALSELLVEKRMLRLGAMVGRYGGIPSSELKRALAAASALHAMATATDPDEVVVVATSAIRDADNRSAVVSSLAARMGVPIQVLDGEGEATLSYIGANAALPDDGTVRVILDLGGGSLELAWGAGRAPSAVATAAVGVARLAAEADVGSAPSRKQLERVRRLVERRVASATRLHGHVPGVPVVLGGGSARAVARVLRASSGATDPNAVQGIVIETTDVAALADQLTATTLEDRLCMAGMSQRRALDLPVAATVVATTLDVLGAAEVTMSEFGLRHGVALAAASARHPAAIR